MKRRSWFRNGRMAFANDKAREEVVRNYREWPLKWWREAIQNAVDGHATQIDLVARELPDGTYEVSCRDNGDGMSRATLLGPFVQFGGSTKPIGSGNIGGFGEAKKLLLLPWISWSARSNGLLLNGVGDWYDDENGPVAVPYEKGCTITTIQRPDLHTSEYAAIEFLQWCELPRIRITINGEPYEGAAFKKGKQIAAWPFGTLYRNKSRNHYRVIVRGSGVYSFDYGRVADGMGAFVLELAPDTKQLLTSHRDGFASREVEQTIDDLLNEMATERERALKKFSKRVSDYRDGESRYVVQAREEGAEELLQRGGTPEATLEQLMVYLGGSLPPAVIQAALTTQPKGDYDVARLAKSLVWKPAFGLENEIEDWRVPARFYPETMEPKVKAVLEVWAEACRWVLMQLHADAEYGVGFIFSEGSGSARACYAHNEKGDWLLINPLVAGRESSKIYSKSSRDDVGIIYALAIHECTHLANGIHSHYDAFAAALTHNFAKCKDGFPAMMRIAQDIKIDREPGERASAHMEQGDAILEVDYETETIDSSMYWHMLIDPPKAVIEGMRSELARRGMPPPVDSRVKPISLMEEAASLVLEDPNAPSGTAKMHLRDLVWLLALEYERVIGPIRIQTMPYWSGERLVVAVAIARARRLGEREVYQTEVASRARLNDEVGIGRDLRNPKELQELRKIIKIKKGADFVDQEYTVDGQQLQLLLGFSAKPQHKYFL